ncbi:type II toxin-antitoxin system VapC family toxin [Cupriavidus taiwanensis]|uniref:type II toxin-antitoxin system VapC family toxin n=1 Tax=Cupriavidus taiwanensis TaxID=164546 RepID=UPI000E10A7BD|nr:type II toxin-antitoxin system VapC family toxin [Cupriavidus taiwanensis]SOY70541.1 PUTATIVE toxin of a toxin/antitoxin system [Cupriavidus taiwanensis]SOY72168.1 PUTATIVE toxin of a toxin/antitoxin system [Cupriavidus taiwanensis]SOY95734.1 PUTATIVE toxin of a toxin/antitoxin system [Cupriavidus taiwanensis]SOZ30060.1 PUTATIVE toxin of a toxin/antitoxin system [Cupriavidus taiwanensis]SOZ74932.1 PUTATIVE toxin of a toxin/antitoxin system [Cupriavidus taiwanensis]
MARFMFDTDMCIYLMKNQPPQVAERFAQCFEGDVVLSAISLAELEYGVTISLDPQGARRALQALIGRVPVLPLNAAAARAYGPVRAATRERKADALDKLIAAHAIAENLTLVTRNVRDFAAYPGLRVEDWTEGQAAAPDR